MLNFIPFTKARINDPVWQKRIELVRTVVLPYQWEILHDRVPGAERSYCIRNFKAAAGDIKERHGGMVFQDTDLYKWLEAVAYVLAVQADPTLEAMADEAIDLISRAQAQDGYLNTYYTLEKPHRRYTNLMEGHELYCDGHFIEAAVAYAKATGKTKVLDIALKVARQLHNYFMDKPGYPGHPEVELALIRLYEHTGERFCFDLALHFINVRGVGENYLDMERQDKEHEWVWEDMKRFDNKYFQAHAPVREQDTAEGHSVRAMYLYSALADAGRITGETALCDACKKLMDNVRTKRMYVTGGIGSSSFGERFTTDYDLPNDTMYCETCASIGLMMFSHRMAKMTSEVSYYDTWERALYNTVLAGMAADGTHFFYVNPLEVVPVNTKNNVTLGHVHATRQSWFGVACCPPNVARTLPSLSGSIYALDEDKALYVMTHIDSAFGDQGITASLNKQGEEFTLQLDGPPMTVKLRVPSGFTLMLNGEEYRQGTAQLRHPGGAAAYPYRLMPITRWLYAHPAVSQGGGKCCLMRGYEVYCLEEKDNGTHLSGLYVSDQVVTEEPSDLFDGLPVLVAQGLRLNEQSWQGELYTSTTPDTSPCEARFIPYRYWGNRGEGEMRVWVNMK